MAAKTIAVIGGGASGALFCAHFLRAASDPQGSESVKIEWIGQESALGLGVAYGTRELAHLLNVPAAGMSAFVDQPAHFLEWLKASHPELRAAAETFAPRKIYGEYLANLVAHADPKLLSKRVDEAIDIEHLGAEYRVQLKSGQSFSADAVILALGALSNLPGQSAYGAMRPSEISAIPAGARVLLIGTGLTMIDTVLSFQAQGHRAALTAVSRRGLLPRRFAAGKPYGRSPEFAGLLGSGVTSLSRALRLFRAECRLAEAQGSAWPAVFDLIRPVTPLLWQSLTPRMKRSFFRHLRPYWDVHRHRVAPEIHEKLRELQNRRSLYVEAARLMRVEKEGSSFRVLFRPKSCPAPYSETFDFLVDCTGFSSDMTAMNHVLLQSVIRRGLVAVDDPPFGISPRPPEHPRVHIIGPLLRAALWETIAVPELRLQAQHLAKLTLNQVRAL